MRPMFTNVKSIRGTNRIIDPNCFALFAFRRTTSSMVDLNVEMTSPRVDPQGTTTRRGATVYQFPSCSTSASRRTHCGAPSQPFFVPPI